MISNSLTLTLLLWLSSKQRRLTFRQLLSSEARKRRDRRIRRRALQVPHISPFAILLGSGCDQSLITLTGFDHRSFNYILDRFVSLYQNYTPYTIDGNIRPVDSFGTRGRPRSSNASHCLGLVLTWNRTRGAGYVLCLLFGITGSVCSLFLRVGRRLLLKALKRYTLVEVRMPNDEEMAQFKNAFASKYSMLENVFYVVDGLKLYLEQSGDCVIQNMFYNGWTHDHYVGKVFVFAPNGVVICCAINAPGAMHDSIIAEWGGICEKLKNIYEEYGGLCVVDSAFSRGHYPFLIKSSQDCVISSDGTQASIATFRQATSARQGSEWGIRAFNGTFARLKDRFVCKERGERKIILICIVLLFNLRARLVGISKILNNPYASFERRIKLFSVPVVA